MKGKISDDHERNPSESSLVDLESTVFNFGVLLLEIISGKLPSDEKGSPVDWVTNLFFFFPLVSVYSMGSAGHACMCSCVQTQKQTGFVCMHAFTY